jgi:hypothetical protein
MVVREAFVAAFIGKWTSILVIFILSLLLCGISPVYADQGDPTLLASGNLGGGISFNSLGEAVWSQWDPATEKNQIFSSLRGQITFDATDHSSPAINNMGDLVWVSRDPDSSRYFLRGYIAGKEVTLVYDSNSSIFNTDLNDRGEVVSSRMIITPAAKSIPTCGGN